LPSVKGRCLDALRLDSFGFILGALGVSGRDSVGLLLARVYSLVDQRLQSAGFVAGGGSSVHVLGSPIVSRTVAPDSRLGFART
jgi:hypothetical protein